MKKKPSASVPDVAKRVLVPENETAVQRVLDRKAQPKTGPPGAIAGLPSDLAARRVVDAETAAEFCGLSVPKWRVMCRNGDGPKPIRLSVNRIGWRLSDLIAWLDQREVA